MLYLKPIGENKAGISLHSDEQCGVKKGSELFAYLQMQIQYLSKYTAYFSSRDLYLVCNYWKSCLLHRSV